MGCGQGGIKNMKQLLYDFFMMFCFAGVILLFHLLVYGFLYWLTDGQIQFEASDTFISPP
jgi:hypothetical protein